MKANASKRCWEIINCNSFECFLQRRHATSLPNISIGPFETQFRNQDVENIFKEKSPQSAHSTVAGFCYIFTNIPQAHTINRGITQYKWVTLLC